MATSKGTTAKRIMPKNDTETNNSKTSRCRNIFKNHAAKNYRILEVFEYYRPILITIL
jgi:hypothetical protein